MPANYVVETIGTGGLTLKSLHTDFIYNGTVAHVVEINEDFFLDKTSSATPDDITIVQPTNGPGRWIRRKTSNLQGNTVSSDQPNDGYVLVWNNTDGYWEPTPPSSIGVQLSGDLSGSSSSVTVVGLQGRSISSAAPTDGYVLSWNDQLSSWEPVPQSSGGVQLSGDLSGSSSSVTVVGLQGYSIASVPPSDGYVLGWVSANNRWEPVQGGVGSGVGASLQNYEYNFLSAVFSTSETTYQTMGSVSFDLTKLSLAPSGGTRTIKLHASVQTTGTTAEIILYNLTSGSTVSLLQSATMLSTSSTSPVLLVSQDLSSLLTNGLGQYEVRMRQSSSSSSSDQVICQMCKLNVEWTS